MAEEQVAEAFDASDPAAEANVKRDAARFARQDADVLRMMMRTKEGRAFLYRFLDRCHIYSTTFAPGQSDVTAFQLGEENVGKRLMLEAQSASVDLYVQMIKEQRAEEARLDEVRRREQRNREQAEAAQTAEELMAPLPPPAGYPGGPALKPKKSR